LFEHCHFAAPQAAERCIERNRIVAAPLEHPHRGLLARGSRQHAQRCCELMADRPFRIIQPLEHRRLHRIVRFPQPPFRDPDRRDAHFA
jgi:hypothetical protein